MICNQILCTFIWDIIYLTTCLSIFWNFISSTSEVQRYEIIVMTQVCILSHLVLSISRISSISYFTFVFCIAILRTIKSGYISRQVYQVLPRFKLIFMHELIPTLQFYFLIDYFLYLPIALCLFNHPKILLFIGYTFRFMQTVIYWIIFYPFIRLLLDYFIFLHERR